MKNMYLHRCLGLILISLGILCLIATQTHAETFTWVKDIYLNPLVGDNESIEVDVVGNQLYVANWEQNKYFRIDPFTGNLLSSFYLGSGLWIDNHGSEYNPTTGLILHANEAGGALAVDSFFATNTNGVVVQGPYPLAIPGSRNPEGLTVDPKTGRVWVSLESRGGGPDGIFQIDPDNGKVLNHIDVGPAWALGFNPNSGKLFFADQNGVIKEVAPDGTGLATVFDPNAGEIFGMAFTPTGDLVLLQFGTTTPPSRLLLFDSSNDADNVFTTQAVPEPGILILLGISMASIVGLRRWWKE